MSASSFSTSAVQEPQEAEALVWARTRVQGGQPLARDRLDDLALADAVAAADLGIVRHGRNGRVRVQGRALRERLAEDQRLADVGDVLAPLQQVEVPAAVGGIAEQHRADDASSSRTTRL